MGQRNVITCLHAPSAPGAASMPIRKAPLYSPSRRGSTAVANGPASAAAVAPATPRRPPPQRHRHPRRAFGRPHQTRVATTLGADLGHPRRTPDAGHDAHAAQPAAAAARHHAGADRRRGAPFAREGAAALAGHEGLRGDCPLGGARGRPDGRRRRRQGATRQTRDGPQPGHRRGDQGRRHDPDQSACGVGRQARARDLRQWPRIGCGSVGTQPENDLAVLKAQEPARRPGAGHHALHRRSVARRRGHCRRPPLRHRAVGQRRRGVRAGPRVPRARRARTR